MAALSKTFSITNGTPGDATQVMQNFNDIKAYINASTLRKDGANAMAAPLEVVWDGTFANASAAPKAYKDGPSATFETSTSVKLVANTQVVLKWHTIIDDTENAYSTITGLYTVALTGVYRITTVPILSHNYAFPFRHFIVAGGVTYKGPNAQGQTGIAENSQWMHTVDAKCLAGDTISAQVSAFAGENEVNVHNLWMEITWLHQ